MLASSLIEIEIRRDRVGIAEILIQELLDIYGRLTEHDIIDKVGHVRTVIA